MFERSGMSLGVDWAVLGVLVFGLLENIYKTRKINIVYMSVLSSQKVDNWKI